MWTRAELKERAKAALRPYYWWGVLTCFIAGLLGAGSGGSSGFSGFSGAGNSRKDISNAMQDGSAFDIGPEIIAFFAAAMVIVIFISLIVIVFSLFVSNVVLVGKLNFFLESRYRNESAGVGSLFFGFSGGRYLNIVKIMFFKGLYEFLWSLLLIIPGIIKHYEYYMVPYLLAEEPAMEKAEAFRISKQMMDGNKFATFVLELSFIGWYLLGILLCCIGGIFVNPYYEATFVELYLKLKENVYGTAKTDTVFVD